MSEPTYILPDADGRQVTITVRRDGRLRSTWRWVRQADGSVLVRIPKRLPKGQISQLLEELTKQLGKQKEVAARRTEAGLQQRAEQINNKYFAGALHWQAIRWVGNMQGRLGSCTHGGATDGHIRISQRIKAWPDWVVDYIIAHELLHTRHPNHSPVFHKELKEAYPLTEQARGFIQGVAFAQGQPLDEQLL